MLEITTSHWIPIEENDFCFRLKRSSSQDFDGDMNEEFRRGGIRATAGARLAWSKDLKINQ